MLLHHAACLLEAKCHRSSATRLASYTVRGVLSCLVLPWRSREQRGSAALRASCAPQPAPFPRPRITARHPHACLGDVVVRRGRGVGHLRQHACVGVQGQYLDAGQRLVQERRRRAGLARGEGEGAEARRREEAAACALYRRVVQVHAADAAGVRVLQYNIQGARSPMHRVAAHCMGAIKPPACLGSASHSLAHHTPTRLAVRAQSHV